MSKQKILCWLRRNKLATANKISKKLRIPLKTTTLLLEKLYKQGIVTKIIRGTRSLYSLKNKRRND